MRDILSFLKIADKKFPQLPSFLYGHKMGGNLTRNYVLRYTLQIKGVIVSGPWLRLAFELPAFSVILGKIMNNIWLSFVTLKKQKLIL